jgi:hypothetical protein
MRRRTNRYARVFHRSDKLHVANRAPSRVCGGAQDARSVCANSAYMTCPARGLQFDVTNCRQIFLVVMLLLSAFVSLSVWAQTTQEEVTEELQSTLPASDVATENTPEALQQQTTSPEKSNISCKEQPLQDTWLDVLQEALGHAACSSAGWVDGLFNTQHQSFDYRSSYGELFTGTTWSQQQEFEKVLRMSAHLNLPFARNRLHAFVGRVDHNEFVTESTNELHALPVAFDRQLQNSVLLGLGYEEPMRKYGAFDADIGMRFDWPADPYAKGSYSIGFPMGSRDLLRLRETVFWQESEHFGTTTRADWDRVVSDNNLLRWTVSTTRSQLRDGWRWYSTLTWYQLFNLKQAMAYEIAANRDNLYINNTVDNYGFTAIYRHNILRKWLWLETRAGVDWPYLPFANERHSNLNAMLAFQMRYGGRN